MVAGHGARRSPAPLTLVLAATLVGAACAGASTSVTPSATVAPVGWEVYLVVDGGPEAIDTFDTFVATFAFTR